MPGGGQRVNFRAVVEMKGVHEKKEGWIDREKF